MLELVLPVVAWPAGIAAGWWMTGAPAPARQAARGYRVLWDDAARRVADTTPGPLVYLIRKQGTDEVKVGCVNTPRPAGERAKEWSTGVSAPIVVEGLVLGVGQRLEHRLHRALRRRGVHLHREWFALPAGEVWWREVVESEAGKGGRR